MNEAHKSVGQIAYEADVAARPLYHDGAPRRTWDQLDEWYRWSWERPERCPKCLRTVPDGAGYGGCWNRDCPI